LVLRCWDEKAGLSKDDLAFSLLDCPLIVLSFFFHNQLLYLSRRNRLLAIVLKKVAFLPQLIINADDFGLHEVINEGIIESHKAGCVTSTTIVAGGDAFEHAVKLAAQNPQLSVGVHLTLVGCQPVARGDVSSLLTSNGSFFPSYREFIQRYLSGRISRDHIEYELRCQLQKVARHGIIISHIDSHQHLHCLSGMAEIVGKLADEFHIRKVRLAAEPVGYFGTMPLDLPRILAKTGLTVCASLAGRYYKRQGLASPDHFYGMLAGGNMSVVELCRIVRDLPAGVSEIMVHPGKNTNNLNDIFHWNYHWQEELEALTSATVLNTIKENNVEMISYHQL
jgi:predicted glycoside hydrolase/deacetylase ChbG (UPF0249 family)